MSSIQRAATAPRSRERREPRRRSAEPFRGLRRLRAQARLGALGFPRAVDVPRAALLPHLARHPGALQAGRPRASPGRCSSQCSRWSSSRSCSTGSWASRVPSYGMPYAVFSYAGLLPWNFFAGALARAGMSLVGNANLITKVYFPRLVIPVSAVLAGLVDFGIAFVVLIGLMAAYRIAPTWHDRLPAVLRPARASPRRWPSASGSAPSTCSTATCSTSSRSWCSSGCS